MNEIEISDLLKELIVSLQNSYAAIEESDEYKSLLEMSENLERSDPDYEKKMKDIEDASEKIEQDALENALGAITEAQKIIILNAISSRFISENGIPTSSQRDSFEDIMAYIVSSLNDVSLLNSLAVNSTFIDAMGYSGYFLTKFIARCTDEEKVLEFFNQYRQGFAPSVAENNIVTDRANINLCDALLGCFNNPGLSSEFKIKLLLSDEMYLYISDYYLEQILKSEELSKEDKLGLLKNDKIYNKLSNYHFSLVLASISTSYEDIKEFLNDENLADKIDIGNFIANVKLESSEYKKVLNDEHVFAKLDWLALERIIKDSEMAYEDRKDIFLDDKFFSMLEPIAVADIMCSKYLTSEQRSELFNEEKVFKAVTSGYLIKLFETRDVPLKDMMAILQDKKFYPYIKTVMIESVFASSMADLDVCTTILFNENLFYRLVNEYHPEYNPNCSNKGPFKYDKYEYLKKLHERNPHIARTLSVELLNDDLLDLGFDFIEKLSKYPNVAHRFAELRNFRDIKFTKSLIEAFQKLENGHDIDITEFITKIINISQDNSFYSPDESKRSFFSAIVYNSNIKFSELNEEEWKTLLEIGFRENSSYNNGIINTPLGNLVAPIDKSLNLFPEVKTREDLQNFEENRLTLCDEEFYRAVSAGDLDKAKNAYFNKYLGINLEEAVEMARLYNSSLEEFKTKPEFSKQTNYLSEIDKILKLESLDVMCNVYNGQKKVLPFEERVFIDQLIRQMFSQSMSESVFKVEDAKETFIEINVDGVSKRVPVYDAGVDFKMLVHSTAAYGQMQLVNDNYFDSWNKSSRKTNHGICCSLISNDNLGMAAVNDVLFGFDSWAPGAISKSAPYDIYSRNDGYTIEEGRSLKYMSAQSIINNTRHTHNEQVLERYELRDERRTEECQNIQPSYVIIYSDMPDEIKQKAVKCSEELHIPIVYLDKEKIIKNEVQKIDSSIQRLEATSSMEEKISLLEKILVSHENNRSGLRMTNKELVDEYFPTDKITALFEKLIAQIKSTYLAAGDVANYSKYANMILDVLDKENNKFIATSEVSTRLNVIDIPVQNLRKSLMGAINNYLDEVNVPKLSAVVDYAKTFHAETPIATALKKADVSLIESMIAKVMEQGFYNESLENNNIGHIERTAILANLIGKTELANENGIVDQKAMDILMTAVLYHDCGKENEHKDPRHGKKSAKKMFDNISDKGFTDEDKKILSIIVEFHEDGNLKDKFDAICERSGLKPESIEYAKKIAFVLQDANYLDRVQRAMLKMEYESPLNLDSSKNLIEIAAALKKYYGTIDRTMFKQMCNSLNVNISFEQSKEPEVQETTGRK